MISVIEKWRPIVGYENYYEVSDWGDIRSLSRRVKCRGGKFRTIDGQIRPSTFNNHTGYMSVLLSKDNKQKRFLIHRLVAEAFIPNPDNLPQVNHINEIKTDNRVENLEFCDSKYNNNYGTKPQKQSEVQINHPLKSKTVYQYTLDGKFIAEYPSTREIQRQLGYNHAQISLCCRDKLKSSHNFIWKYGD